MEPQQSNATLPLAPKYLLESVLFVATEPVQLGDLARCLDLPVDVIASLLAELANEYAERGLRIQRHHDMAQFVTAPLAATTIHRFLGNQSTTPRLGNAALETLAIIAYKQPLTKAGLEAIRGVDCSGTVRTLLQRGLVAEVGRQATAGRPVLYGTTDEFLRQFGIADVGQLPPLHTTNAEPHPPMS